MTRNRLLTGLLTLSAAMTLAACSPQANSTTTTTQTTTITAAATGTTNPAAASNIQSVANVPLLTLNNGVQLPQLGLGTQIQSLEGDASPSGRDRLNETTRASVVAALQAGYRHLDTAHGYYNERGVGQGIKDSGVPREEIWLTSKLWPSDYANATAAIDAMLERLQVDYIDMVYLHHPTGDYMAAYRALEQAVADGKVRAIGISNFDNEPDIFNDVMAQATIKPQALQIEMHPLAQRTVTRELAAQNNIQVEAWYPLGHADAALLNNATLTTIANAHGKTTAQVILRWLMQEGVAAVPGSTNPDHIQENLDIFDFELSDAEMAQILSLDQGEAERYFNIDYDTMGRFFMNLND